MEGPGAAAAVGAGPGGSNVPAFLTKLWTLVEDPDTDSLICWSPSGNSFHVFDQGQFAKEVLPKYFKHNNMASFVRQLNMYGFRKVVHIEQGGLVKPEKDDTEFQHPYFIRGQEHLLENIKRKVTSVSSIKNEDIKVRQDNVTKLLTDIQVMKGKQESMDSKLIAMKQSSPVVRIKEEPPSPARSPQIEEASPGNPPAVETPLSPSTFIDSILQENEPSTTTAAAGDSTTQPQPQEKCLSVACLDNLTRTSQMSEVTRLCPSSSSSSLHCRSQQGNELNDHLDTIDSNLDNLQTMLTTHGFSVDTSALLDLFSPSMTVTDMNLPDLDSSLASIQDLLSSQEQQKPTETEAGTADTGKQLVHYTAQPLFLVDSSAVDMGSGDLPIFFELGEGPYFTDGDEYSEDPTISLLSGTEQSKPKDPAIS
ncbi:heat shock factor protein 1 isoform X8 [Calonectris borealis]|uniref:heat shock factor protein 1 isoform X8 n=1 Tax=Calonectris borealis TaxID=1323832 RepID=UPI003F4C6378